MLPGGVFNQSYARDVAIVRTRTQWLMLLAALAFVFSIPAFANDYWLGWLTKLFIVIIAVLGLHILTGLCGQFSIGHAAFVGVGAYTAAILTTKYGLSGWLCLPLSALVAGIVGLFFALPCFRLKGFYLAVSTLAASFIIIWCMRHFASVTGGLEGLDVSTLTIAGVDLTYNQPAYWLAAVITVVRHVRGEEHPEDLHRPGLRGDKGQRAGCRGQRDPRLPLQDAGLLHQLPVCRGGRLAVGQHPDEGHAGPVHAQ